MTPIEEQILRNQTAILGLLSLTIPTSEEGLENLNRALKCVKETFLLLKTESQQGRTVHAYPA